MYIFTGTFNTQQTQKCATCNLNLSDEQSYRQHYKSEHHRYNLKRRSVNLPPATLEQFYQKKKSYQNPYKKAEIYNCDRCMKKFTTESTYKQHLQSKKHQYTYYKSYAKRIKVERVISKELCLFCTNISDNFYNNLKHMNVAHGFFISQYYFCKDKEGLIIYLHEKVEVGLMCLYCENKGTKGFVDGQSLRNHMKDRSHTSMRTEDGYEEYEKFYDFTKLFYEKLAEQKYLEERGRLAGGLDHNIVYVGDDESSWESDDDGVIEEEEEVTEEKQVEEKVYKGSKTLKYLFYQPTLTYNGELLLPSGKLLGHRKYRHLYKQYYRPFWFKQPRLQVGQQSEQQLVHPAFELIRAECQLRPHIHRHKLTELRLKLRQNKLQYHFRCQNPK